MSTAESSFSTLLEVSKSHHVTTDIPAHWGSDIILNLLETKRFGRQGILEPLEESESDNEAKEGNDVFSKTSTLPGTF